jgi:hypothetical protein
MSRFGAIVFVCVLASGCASWGTHADSVTTCERGFANDPEWSRIARPGRDGRSVWRQFPDFEFEGANKKPGKASTLWFRNETKQEIGSCSMHSCESGKCTWRIRLFTKRPDGWQLRSAYDIGKVRAKSRE